MKEYPTVEISCDCFENKGLIIDDGKKKLKELAKFQRYRIDLDRFLKEISSSNSEQLCDINDRPLLTSFVRTAKSGIV